MKFTTGFIVVTLAAFLTLSACVTPIWNDGEIGLTVSPLASLKRLQQSEANFNEALDKLTDSVVMLSFGQNVLAQELQNEAIALQATQAGLIADAAKQKRELENAIIKAQDDMAIDWTTIILAALGVGGVGAGVPTLASRKRRGASIITGKMPAKPARKKA